MWQTFVVIVLILVSIFSCKDKNGRQTSNSTAYSTAYSSSGSDSENDNTYKDGEYCATVTYYNPNTGTRSNYQLTVEVEDNELTFIHWPNGGWLDDSHFTPEELNEDGSVSFTSDRGYRYTVEIEDEGPCTYSSTNAVSAEEAAGTHVGEEEGYVIWDYTGCDYIIIETRMWYVVAEKRPGSYFLDRGDKVRGDIVGYGFEDVYSFSRDDEVSLYIDSYWGAKSNALERVMEQCHLDDENDY